MEINTFVKVLRRDESSSAWKLVAARAIVRKLGTKFAYVSYPTDTNVARYADTGEWLPIESNNLRLSLC
jgi:hypothetical protein